MSLTIIETTSSPWDMLFSWLWIEGLCSLQRKLDKYLPPDYSEVVYSPFYNDTPELSRYHLSETEEKE